MSTNDYSTVTSTIRVSHGNRDREDSHMFGNTFVFKAMVIFICTNIFLVWVLLIYFLYVYIRNVFVPSICLFTYSSISWFTKLLSYSWLIVTDHLMIIFYL